VRKRDRQAAQLAPTGIGGNNLRHATVGEQKIAQDGEKALRSACACEPKQGQQAHESDLSIEPMGFGQPSDHRYGTTRQQRSRHQGNAAGAAPFPHQRDHGIDLWI